MTSARPLSELTYREKYMVLHKIGNQRRTRSSCIIFLERVGDRYAFDARPIAGTLTLEANDILDFVKAPVGMRPYVNRIETVTEWPMEPEELVPDYEKCDHCGQPIKDGESITKISVGHVFNNGEIDMQVTDNYHSTCVAEVWRSAT